MRITARLTGGVLAALAVLHLGWGLGSAFPFRSRRELADAVVGSSRVPPPTACFAVAGALATGTALVVKVIPLPPPVRRESLFGMAAVFGVRFGLLWEDGSRFSRQRLREVHSSRPANLRADMSWAVDWLGGFHGSTIRSDVDTSRSRRRSYHLSTPLSGLGSENSGQNIDESLGSRTRSYLVTRFRDRGARAEGRRIAGKSAPEGERTGESQTHSPGIYPRGR
jgi:hypothetical protein